MTGRPDELLARILGPDLLELLDEYVRARVQEQLNGRDAEQRWLTVKAAAEYLGLSEKAVRRRVERGVIAYTRQGTRILIDRHALDAGLVRRLRNGPDG